MQYYIEVEKRTELDGFLKANLIEKEAGTVAAITTYRSDEKPDPACGIYALEWQDEHSEHRFFEYTASLKSFVKENAISMGLDVSPEHAAVLHRDELICNLLDVENIYYHKKLAENNTLYSLANDPDNKICIAPNPYDQSMQKALDLVFGRGLATVLNDTLPDNPEEYIGL
ncbi:hypothetical protein [Syntrophotalea acetylenica]|uniref:hypothetical protein n=1 Tax=Syntrophotalea acetylenica TaxID=29542 RepID=UPI002A360844|nr:hypothetical protein [Syntrophotalea acetylenica]MDY0263454.1 hypothetical protein [Syntrophotalea acetylenica]